MRFPISITQYSANRPVTRYSLAALLVLLATLLTRMTQPVLGEISPIYFAAVVVSTWLGGLGPGLLATALAGWASAYFFYDIPVGSGAFGWDDTLRLGVFLMVALLMSSLMHLRARAEDALRRANDSLEQRVSERTAELKQSNQLVLDISEQEQRRIGHDLHDGLGQQLTGIAFLSQNLTRQLRQQSTVGVAEADRISALVSAAINQTRDLARGLSPVEFGSDGLVAALRNLSIQVDETSKIKCRFHCEGKIRIDSHTAAMHLYRIAQEASNNAARHSDANEICITLEEKDYEITLTIRDDGIGFATDHQGSDGMGLHLMRYRARMMGAVLEIRSGEIRLGDPVGTVVRCVYRRGAEVQTI